MDQLATPALIIDLLTVERNLARLADYAAEHELDVRPHTKTHKSKHFAAMQIAAGARGLTAAKVGEAEVMAEVTDDVLVAFPALDRARTRRIAALGRHHTVRVAVDSKQAATALAEAARSGHATIGIVVDLDVGMGRTGVQTPSDALKIAQHVDQAAGLRLDGLFCYPGHVSMPADEQEPALEAVSQKLFATLDLWTKHGLQARMVSGGSTPTAYQSHLVGAYTEIRPGTYIFNDMNTVRGGFCSIDDCAARIVATVVSTSVPGQMVLDAGSKTLTSDRCAFAPDSGHGLIIEYPAACIFKLSEEHAQVRLGEGDRVPELGERVTIIPNHICPCVNLQDTVWLSAEGQLEPAAVDARGKLS